MNDVSSSVPASFSHDRVTLSPAIEICGIAWWNAPPPLGSPSP